MNVPSDTGGYDKGEAWLLGAARSLSLQMVEYDHLSQATEKAKPQRRFQFLVSEQHLKLLTSLNIKPTHDVEGTGVCSPGCS